jgi:hypothetical protein
MLCMFRLCILCIVCKCVLFHCHRGSTQLQLNISYHNVVQFIVIKLILYSLKERDTEHLKNKDVEGRITLKIDLKETWRGSLQGYQIRVVLSMMK